MADLLNIVFPLYPGLTQLDFTGPHQFFSRLPGAHTVIASLRGGEIEAEGGMIFAGTISLAEVKGCDILCVPGGLTATEAALDASYLDQIRRLALAARYVTSVGTGSLILGAAGLLRGRKAACHWQWREVLPLFGAVPDPGRVVRDGNVITGSGVTAGIDFALTLAAEVAGEPFARALQLGFEYAPEPPFNEGSPQTASLSTIAAAKARVAPLIAMRYAQAREAAARLDATD